MSKKNCKKKFHRDLYAQWFLGALTPDEKYYNQYTLAIRRYINPKPYSQYIKKVMH